MADENPTAESSGDSAGANSSGLTKLLVIVAGVMVIEAVGFFFLMPTSAGSEGDPVVEEVEKVAEEKEQEAVDQAIESEVGEFRISNAAAAPDAVLHLEFQVHLQTPQELANELQALLTKRKYLVRETIAITARKATYKDLEEPSLGCFKRQIKDRLSKILGKEYVKGVIISNFNMYQQ